MSANPHNLRDKKDVRRFRAQREQLKRYRGRLPESQGHNLAVTVLDVPSSLDSRTVKFLGCNERKRQNSPRVLTGKRLSTFCTQNRPFLKIPGTKMTLEVDRECSILGPLPKSISYQESSRFLQKWPIPGLGGGPEMPSPSASRSR